MNFWTFLDRNSEGLFFFGVIVLCFAFGTCGDGQGCRLGCQPSVSFRSSPTDGGAP
ncbi:hypothetical protein AKJ09_00086 [Labilithrix luteola]|uniref:Uncharacterized protein n=1 Tax=Labilithrix luteola TaxID=1391654 RepID=A0A0K1PIS8_9BACT|nr:hypothetical protein [Labilithrix luteola]AKU93354.1 hypothetical protein AKJ09_00018 [Labilithrix luteola]AKU93422.1 hypothetical protein AKJ09_00086 [Labilithrix luteola]